MRRGSPDRVANPVLPGRPRQWLPMIDRGGQILLIEDDFAIRVSLALALGKHGHDVVQASTG